MSDFEYFSFEKIQRNESLFYTSYTEQFLKDINSEPIISTFFSWRIFYPFYLLLKYSSTLFSISLDFNVLKFFIFIFDTNRTISDIFWLKHENKYYLFLWLKKEIKRAIIRPVFSVCNRCSSSFASNIWIVQAKFSWLLVDKDFPNDHLHQSTNFQ